MIKRLFDLFAASVGLILVSPLFLLLAILIKLDSPGPVFFRGQRVGQHGRPFHMFKFRSMVADAALKGPGLTAKGDPRVTRVGGMLRRTKLDELPQLINVIRGEMSLVGPRPEDPRYVALYTQQQRSLLRVPPGITSMASIRYRNEELMLSQNSLYDIYVEKIMPEKLAIELDYVEKQTFGRDLYVLGATLLNLFR